MTLVGEATVDLDLIHRVTDVDLSTPFDLVRQTYSTVWSNGDDDDEANIQFHERRTLTAGSSQTYTLDDASLSDQFDTALTFAYLKCLFLFNRSTTVALKIGQPSTYAWYLDLMASGAGYSFRTIPPETVLLLATPQNEASLADFQQRFQVYNEHASASVAYDICLVGVSA